jgi:hypothetical protein
METARRTGQATSVTGVNQFTLSVPVRVRHNCLPLTLSDGSVRKGGGGVNDFVVYFDFSRRMQATAAEVLPSAPRVLRWTARGASVAVSR